MEEKNGKSGRTPWRDKLVHLEDGQQYAITITLNNLNQSPNKTLEFHTSMKRIWKWLPPWADQIVLHMELTPLRNTVHYHGTFIMKDIVKYHHTLSKIHENLGYLMIKEIENFMEWDAYTKKEQGLMKRLFPTAPSALTRESFKEYFRVYNKEERERKLSRDICKYNFPEPSDTEV